jgi:hypothetical protein
MRRVDRRERFGRQRWPSPISPRLGDVGVQTSAKLESSHKKRVVVFGHRRMLAHEAQAIVLLAKARIGELTAELAKAQHGGKGGGSKVPDGNSRPKRDALAAEGLSRKDAAC